MKKLILTIGIMLVSIIMFAQNYRMSNVPVTVTCSGTETFYDSGGSGSPYSNGETFTKTFCTDADHVLCFDFTAFRTNDAGDILTIYDGPTTASPIIGTYTGNLGAFGPIYSSGSCITFKFVSNLLGTRAGWAAVISCFCRPYSLTMYDSGCNGIGTALYAIYFDGSLAGAVNQTTCNRTLLLYPLMGTNIMVNYQYDGNPLIDTQNSFELRDGYGNIVAAGFIPDGGITGATSILSVTASCAAPTIGDSYIEDCGWTQTICSNSSFSGNSSGTGNIFELNLTNTGCLFGEHQSSWYYFQAQTSGNLGFTISPDNGTDDYDFAIWKTTSCPPNSQPIRCSWAGVAGNTGAGNSALDNSESFDGDSWVSTIPVIAGEEFALLIDNWSSTGSPYSLTWNLSGGASLDCTPLSLNVVDAQIICEPSRRTIKWSTLSETNSDYVIVQSSEDNMFFNNIDTILSMGFYNSRKDYTTFDNNVYDNSLVYYQLYEIDGNGESNLYTLGTSSCLISSDNINIYPNPGKVNEEITIDGDYYLIEIFDILGRKINYVIKNNKILNLSSGVYIIVINNDKKIKLIIQ